MLRVVRGGLLIESLWDVCIYEGAMKQFLLQDTAGVFVLRLFDLN